MAQYLARLFSRPWRRGAIWLLLAVAVVGVLAGAVRVPSEQFTVETSPVPLPAGGDHHQVRPPAPVRTQLPVDGWLRGFSYELVDENGQRLPTQLLHHVNLIAPERRDLFSPIMLRVGAAGPETPPYSVPRFLGLPVHRGDSLLVTAMLHNPTGTSYEGVRLRIHLDVSQGTPWMKPLSVQPLYLDVMPPAGVHSFDLPAGRSTKSWEATPAIAARLLAAGGHMHQYGTSLRLEDVTTGDLLWETRPEVGKKGEVERMPFRYFLPFGLKLDPEHVYRLTAEYDNPTGKVLVSGGMGAIGGIVIPVSGGVWPSVARGDSVYQHDVWITTGPGSAHGQQGHHPH